MTPKDKTPTVQQSPATATVPNPPIDVARVHPGKHLLGSLLTIPVLLTLLLDANSSTVQCAPAPCPRPKPGLAKHEPHATERVPLPA